MLLARLSILLSLLGLTGYGATFGTVTPALGAADLVLDQPRGRLYLINSNLNRVQVYSIAQRTFLASITTGTQPLAGAMSPDGKFLYVTCHSRSEERRVGKERTSDSTLALSIKCYCVSRLHNFF